MRYQVTVDDAAVCGVLDIQGSPDALASWPATAAFAYPDTPNTFTLSGSHTLYWVGRQHWLLRSELEQESALLKLVNEPDIPDTISIVQISDSLSFFSILGPDADQVLSIASPMDIHPSVFPDNGASYTEVFGLKALVIRCAGGFEIAVDRSYTDMLEDYLRRSTAG